MKTELDFSWKKGAVWWRTRPFGAVLLLLMLLPIERVYGDQSIIYNDGENNASSITVTLVGNSGTLIIGSSSAIQSGTISASGATLTIATTGVLTLGGNAGTITLGNTGTVTGIGNAGTITIANTGTLVLGNAGTITVGNSATGNGTVTLTGGSGITELSGGSSLITNSVIIANGTTLEGTGALGAITVQAGGTLLPGATTSLGTMTASQITWNAGAQVDLLLSNSSNSSSTLNLGNGALVKNGNGTFTFNFLGTGEAGQTYTLINFGTTSTYGVVTPNANFNTDDFDYINLAPGLTGVFSFVDNGSTESLVITLSQSPSLYFQNGTALGNLSLNTTFLPQAWTETEAIDSGWQERAIADINGDGIDDIIFQNGTLIGALIMNPDGTQNSWVGIGAMNAGWELRGVADITNDGNIDLIFQNGALLGYLEINKAGQPVSWTGIGAMNAGWELRAVASLDGTGQPDLVFQNGALIGALNVNTSGAPTAWIGIGAVNSGWILSDAVDVNGDGQPDLIFQNGTFLGALQVNTSLQPTAWSGIGAMSTGWTLPGNY
jgi:hypothetical protein